MHLSLSFDRIVITLNAITLIFCSDLCLLTLAFLNVVVGLEVRFGLWHEIIRIGLFSALIAAKVP